MVSGTGPCSKEGRKVAISLSEGVEYETIEEGEVLFKEGEPVSSFYLVSSGKVVRAKTVDSRIVFVGVAEAGELIAEETVMGGYQRHLYGAVALERSEVCVLSRREALSVVGSKSDWVQNILKNMSE